MSDDVVLHSLSSSDTDQTDHISLSQKLHLNFPSLPVCFNLAELSSSSLATSQSRLERSPTLDQTILADWKICNLNAHQERSFASLLLAEIDNERYFSCSLYYCPWTDLEAKKV